MEVAFLAEVSAFLFLEGVASSTIWFFVFDGGSHSAVNNTDVFIFSFWIRPIEAGGGTGKQTNTQTNTQTEPRGW